MSRSHTFDDEHAARYGLEEAVALHRFLYWIEAHEEDEARQHEGRTWIFCSVDYLLKRWPFLGNERRVRRVLDSLVKQGVLLRANAAQRARLCAQTKRDAWRQIAWYALVDQPAFLGRDAPATKRTKVAASEGPELDSSERPESAASKTLTPCSQHGISAAAAKAPDSSPADGGALPRAAAALLTTRPDPESLLSPAAKLLYSTGWFPLPRCSRLAEGFAPELIAEVIARAQQRPEGRQSGFVIHLLKGIRAGTEAPPEGYIRRQQEDARQAILVERVTIAERQREAELGADPEADARQAAVLAEYERFRTARQRQRSGEAAP